MHYLIIPEIGRGFFSCILTILNSIKSIKEDIKNYNSFTIDPNYFLLYGHISNWFDIAYDKELYSRKYVPFFSVAKYIENKKLYCDRPDKTELTNLKKYSKYIPFKKEIYEEIDDSIIKLENTIGIHYRGLEHTHSAHINEENLINLIKKGFDKTNKIFICSDSNSLMFSFAEKIIKLNKDVELIFNEKSLTYNIKNLNSGFHTNNYFNEETKAKMGRDIILETHMLLNCCKIYGKYSNIMHYISMNNSNSNIIYV